MLRNLGEPSHLIILAILLIVIFGYKRLPDAARGIGRSMRVFKSEMEEMKTDGKDPNADQPAQQGQAPVQQPPYEQRPAQQPQYQPPVQQPQYQQGQYQQPQPQYQAPAQQPQPQYQAPAQQPQHQQAPVQQPQYTPDGTQSTYQATGAAPYTESPVHEDAPRTDNQPGPAA